jgi:hypothetical protein
MAVIDDLVSAGLSNVQAVQVIAEDTNSNNVDNLVQAGFSPTLAAAMNAYDANKTDANLDVLVQQGMWAGSTLTAVKAALDVTA